MGPVREVEATVKITVPGKDSIPLPERIEAKGRIVAAGAPKLTKAGERRKTETNPENFTYFTPKGGPGFQVRGKIMEDSKGNIWMGSYGRGVSRFDGVNYANFSIETGLPLEVITCTVEDSRGHIWIGTNGGGACRYDGETFIIFGEKEGLHNQILSIAESEEGKLYFGTRDGGLFCYEPGDKGDGGYFTKYTTMHGMDTMTALELTFDNQGNLWFFDTNQNFGKFEPARNGKPERIFQFGPNQNSFDGPLSGFDIASDGLVWVGGFGGTLFSFDGEVYTHYDLPEPLSTNGIGSIFYEQASDKIWFPIKGEGIAWFHPNDLGSLNIYTKAHGLYSDVCYRIFVSENGTLYADAKEGFIIKTPNAFETTFAERGMPEEEVNSITEDAQGRLWVSLENKGLFRYDEKYIAEHNNSTGFHQSITGLTTDHNGNLWLATGGGGLHKYIPDYDSDLGTLHYYMEMAGLSLHYLTCVMEDSKGRIWAGTNGGGINILEPDAGGGKGGRLTHLKVNEGLSANQIYTICEAKNGDFWIGTHSGGVVRFRPKGDYEGTFTHYGPEQGLTHPSAISITEDDDGYIWIGTPQGGLQMIMPTENGADEQIVSFPTKSEPFGNMIYGSTKGDSGTLWFLGRKALLKLTAENRSRMLEKLETGQVYHDDVFFSALTAEDGYQGLGGRNSIYIDKSGNLLLGVSSYLLQHEPYTDVDTVEPPVVAITSMNMASDVIDWTAIKGQESTNITLQNGVKLHDFEFDALLPHYGLPGDLRLAHDNNNLSFSYAAIAAPQGELVKYSYKLDGLDNQWSPLSERTEVPYGNLGHGEYTFRVKALDSRGNWSDEATYEFTINPPWWLSNAAYAIYTLLLVLAGIILYRGLKKRTLRIEREKSQARELAQAKEIEAAYAELRDAHKNLKSTQAQLIQSEKMASLGELTSGIAHEIQNPLNFVNNFSELSAELLDEVSEELAKTRHALSQWRAGSPSQAESPDGEGSLSEAETILTDIKSNLQKITHHGKRADAIVKGMLAHSRSGKGEKSPTDINALAEEYLKLSYHGIRAKDKTFNADFKTDFDPNLPKLNVVPQDIGRVLLNLINNAFQAVQTGQDLSHSGQALSHSGPSITVSTKKRGNHIEISVKDNGPGIPDSIKDKIFQPFFTTKPTGQGTGLGLSLSYDIVKAHGGELKVESTNVETGPDGATGCKFVVQLPLS
ncbi:MAG: hypothetical protein LC670_04545 [Flavobacteriales bacterium]|nr:hypothetical protein [Flavobacteriales bacterium]